MKRFKPMMCPVCGKFYFSGPLKDFEDEELKEYLEGDVQCSKCGWIYDLDQAENPTSKDGFNELSLEEYKKHYEQKLKDDPNYDYLEANAESAQPHKCPVCGEYEFPDLNSYDICPICGWEDEEYFEGGGANDMSLEEAKADFAEKRKLNPKYKWSKRNKS